MPVDVQIDEDRDTDALLARLEIGMRGKAVKSAVRAAAAPVRTEARRLAPRSEETGTRDVWSQATEAERAGAKEHHQTISVAVRDYGDTFVAVVGASYPAGALGHLIEEGHQLVAWGQPLAQWVEGQPYLEPAADSTKPQQRSAFIAKLTDAADKLLPSS